MTAGERARRSVLVAGLVAIGCRAGGIAGTNSACDDDHPCRGGYVCIDLRCRVGAPVPDGGLPEVEGHLPVRDGARPGDDARLADAGQDQASQETATPPPPFTLVRCQEHKESATGCTPGMSFAVSLAPDLSAVASVRRGILKLWKVDGGALVAMDREFNAPDGWVAFFSPDSTLVGTIARSTIHVWKVATGVEVFSYAMPMSTAYPRGLGFAGDGQRLLAAWGSELALGSIGRTTFERTIPIAPFFSLSTAAERGAGGGWWAALFSRPIEMTDPTPARLALIDLNAPSPTPLGFDLPGAEDGFTIALGPQARLLALHGERTVKVWDLRDRTRPLPAPLIVQPPLTGYQRITGSSLSHSGKHLAVAFGASTPPEGGLMVVSTEDGATTAMRALQGTPTHPRFSDDGRALGVMVASCPLALVICRE